MAYGKLILAGGLLALAMFIAGTQKVAHTIRIEAAIAEAEVRAMDKGGDLAVVVATGSAGRIEAGFELMLDKDASRMLITGTGAGVSKDDILKIAGSGQTHKMDALAERLDCCVDLGAEAVNTKGNASEAIAWVQSNGIGRIILVTADFHMPRILVEFRRLMPGLEVMPYPVPTKGLGKDVSGGAKWWRSSGQVLLVAREYGKYLASLAG